MISSSSERSFPKNLKWALFAYFICFIIIYHILQLNYRLAEIDDTWWISFSYNFFHHGITYDLISGSNVFSAGVQHFGKTYSFLIGVFLDFFGWTKPSSYFLSLLFIFGGFISWYFILRRFQYSRELCVTFCVTGLLLDPFFSAAVSARSEAFVFLVSSLAFLLFVFDRYFESMAVAWIGLETHPIGAVAFFLMAAAFWAPRPLHLPPRPKISRIWILSSAGFGLGALYYLLLHSDGLAQLPQSLLSQNQLSGQSVQNFMFDYFFHSKYHRHLLELALLVFCAWEFFRYKIFLKDPLIITLSISLLLFTLIFRRPQYHYALYFYPAFLLIVARVFEARWNLRWMVWGFLAALLPQYAFAYHLNQGYDYNLEIRTYQKMIPEDSLPVMGGPDAWFAFPGRDFYLNQYWGDIQKLGLTRFYLINDEGYRKNSTALAAYIQTHFTSKPIGAFSMNRQDYRITLEEPISPNNP
jgi:hypothetical protein